MVKVGQEWVERCGGLSKVEVDDRREHTSACVSIRQHTSAYVSIRQHTSAYVSTEVEVDDRRERLTKDQEVEVRGGRGGHGTLSSSTSSPSITSISIAKKREREEEEEAEERGGVAGGSGGSRTAEAAAAVGGNRAPAVAATELCNRAPAIAATEHCNSAPAGAATELQQLMRAAAVDAEPGPLPLLASSSRRCHRGSERASKQASEGGWEREIDAVHEREGGAKRGGHAAGAKGGGHAAAASSIGVCLTLECDSQTLEAALAFILQVHRTTEREGGGHARGGGGAGVEVEAAESLRVEHVDRWCHADVWR